MNRRGSGWLIGVLVLVTALGLAASLIPFRTCESCEGYDLHLKKIFSEASSRSYPGPLDCPDCADRGKVSLVRAWRPRVSDGVRQSLRVFRDPTSAPFMNRLELLILEPGMKREAYLEANGQRAQFAFPRFVKAEGTPYLVIPAYYPLWKSSDGTGTGFLLVHPDGRALDCVQMTCTNRLADINFVFLEKPATDGSQMALSPIVDPVPQGVSYKLHQWRQAPREAKVSTALYLRIRGERFEILDMK